MLSSAPECTAGSWIDISQFAIDFTFSLCKLWTYIHAQLEVTKRLIACAEMLIGCNYKSTTRWVESNPTTPGPSCTQPNELLMDMLKLST